MAPPPEVNPPSGAESFSSGEPAGAAAGKLLAAARPAGRRSGRPERPGWTLWLPVGLSAMLLVLFAVVVNRQQAQAERISELIARVQSLEHSRTLERTAVLEQQLRSMLGRLQDLQKQEQRQDQLARGLQTLEQEVRQLRASSRPTLIEPPELPPAADPINRPGRSRSVTPLIP